MKKKIIRITTVPLSLSGLLKGQLRFMSQYFDILGISSKGEDNHLEKLIDLEGIPTVAVEMTRKITPLKDLVAVYQLYKVFKKEKPFIVHSHTPKAGTLGMLAAFLAGVPHRLHTIAGLPLVEATGLKRTLLNTVESITYSCATKIYPNSYGLKDIILEEGFTKEPKLKVIANGSSNGIDTSLFDPQLFNDADKNQALRTTLNIKPNDFVFVFIGRLVTDKGINELVAAFKTLHAKQNHIKLLLVGPYETELDPLLPETLEFIEQTDAVMNTGWVDDVRPYFAISNALTFPSYREGFPNVVMQAGAMELPCIVTDINGCNEIVDHEKTGLIIPVKDTEALLKAMETVLELGDASITMGKLCRTHIVNNFERQVVWDALLSEYNALK
ncbi:glycosyltransferase family 4 protein [Algibacter lectus]|uniref:glycosyltransferase family 4 protein n=1 Tax=Algibacter lectus TaxID=221126 RepID=UPI0026EAE757|nr:glycosyltransferase family 4 protein [Algibacter lectus]MDO7136441.1 glycosyltransferase family 4 protein [Algibacter lectus]